MVAVAALGVGVRSKLPQCGMRMARLSSCVAESSASPGASSTACLGKPPTSAERQQTSAERQQARLLHQLCEEWFGCGVSSQDFSTADTFVQHMLVRHHGWMPIANVVNPKCDPECTQPIRAPTAAPNALPSALLPRAAEEAELLEALEGPTGAAHFERSRLGYGSLAFRPRIFGVAYERMLSSAPRSLARPASWRSEASIDELRLLLAALGAPFHLEESGHQGGWQGGYRAGDHHRQLAKAGWAEWESATASLRRRWFEQMSRPRLVSRLASLPLYDLLQSRECCEGFVDPVVAVALRRLTDAELIRVDEQLRTMKNGTHQLWEDTPSSRRCRPATLLSKDGDDAESGVGGGVGGGVGRGVGAGSPATRSVHSRWRAWLLRSWTWVASEGAPLYAPDADARPAKLLDAPLDELRGGGGGGRGTDSVGGLDAFRDIQRGGVSTGVSRLTADDGTVRSGEIGGGRRTRGVRGSGGAMSAAGRSADKREGLINRLASPTRTLPDELHLALHISELSEALAVFPREEDFDDAHPKPRRGQSDTHTHQTHILTPPNPSRPLLPLLTPPSPS